MDKGFTEMMPHRVKIKPKASFDEWGQPASTRTKSDVPAYIDPKMQTRSRQTSMADDVRGATIILGDTDVTPDDIVVLPDGTERIIRSVARYDGIPELDHVVVTVE